MLERYRTRDLPRGLEPLAELALDLRWTWNHRADELWNRLDPALWSLTKNPWLILQTVSMPHLLALAEDKEYLERLSEIHELWTKDDGAKRWFSMKYAGRALSKVAYFSMEFGISESLPIYAGGLGILAGDHLKSAEDLGVPLVGVGLLFQKGYFRQVVNDRGEQIESYPYNDPDSLPIVPLRGESGQWLRIPITLPGRILILRVWKARLGRITLYLLDSNDPVNAPMDRGITGELYEGGREMRLVQEIVLGIGGYRTLHALGLSTNVLHINEGHPAFAILERAHIWMLREKGKSFRHALETTRIGNVFTTHTPVPAGFDSFDPVLFHQYFSLYQKEWNLLDRELLALGRQNPDDMGEPFNMAWLAIRGSGFVNGVSRIHGEVSRKIFAPLFSRWPLEEVPVTHITNGIHVPSWLSAASSSFWSEKVPGRKADHDGSSAPAAEIFSISDEEVWDLRMKNRMAMIEGVSRHLTRQRSVRGVLDPLPFLDPNALYIGLARRFTSYKRPNLLLYDHERLLRILGQPDRPVRILVAGKAHPQDVAGKGFIQEWVHFASDPRSHGTVFFLSDYDMNVAQVLVGGADLWINCPRRPWEASGTSGMKILANGGLNCSVRDGWWEEAYAPGTGWAIGEDSSFDDPQRDRRDAEALYRILEEEVLPEFYGRDSRGVPLSWIARVKKSMATLTPVYRTERMVREYVEKAYLPAAELFERRQANGGALAHEIEAWREHLAKNWEGIHIGRTVEGIANSAETSLLECPVWLGEIDPQDVAVEMVAMDPAGGGPFVTAMDRVRTLAGARNGYVYAAAVPSGRPVDDYTLRVVPYREGVRVPLEESRILWQG
ncbi:MAG: alpha-glucan family phosphorylase [Leptospirillia bacterium]